MAKIDYYKILGVDRNATADEIKKKYKKLAVKYHPDKQQGKSDEEKKSAEEKFKEINEAYSILSDNEKRQQYDTFGTVNGNMGGMSGADAMAEFMKHFQNMSGFGGFGDFGDFFGGGNSQQPRYVKGGDIQINVNVTMEELYNNNDKEITFKHKVRCETCNGTGSSDGLTNHCPYCNGTGYVTTTQRRGFAIMQQTTVCPHCGGNGKTIKNLCAGCGGSGLVQKEEKYKFTIPYGATSNAYMVLDNMGNAPQNGGDYGVNGDARLVFVAKPHDKFKINQIDAYDIDYVKELPIIDCIMGCKVKFTHLDGKDYSITVKPGVTDGYVVKVRDKGLRRANGQRGYLNVIIKQKMPTSLTENEKKTLNELKKSKNFK